MENTKVRSLQIYQEIILIGLPVRGLPSGELGELLALMQELDMDMEMKKFHLLQENHKQEQQKLAILLKIS